jgi:Vacuolar segregation subunit 7
MPSSVQKNDTDTPSSQSQRDAIKKATDLAAHDPQVTNESSPNKAGNGSTPTNPKPQEFMRPTARSSREGSPVRPSETATAGASNNKLRKNSTDLSPTRIARITDSFAGIPSAAAVQRAMAAQKPVTLLATGDAAADPTKPDKIAKSGHNSPSWPISPRLRSPPPSLSGSRGTASIARKIDAEQSRPNTLLKRLAPVSTPELGALMETRETEEDTKSPSSDLRSPVRGASTSNSLLETVVEGSVPTTPSIGPFSDPLANPSVNDTKIGSSASAPALTAMSNDQLGKESTTAGKDTKVDSEGKNKVEAKPPSTTRPTATNLAKRSFTNLTGGKGRATVEPARTMTVETETVESIPQIIGGDRGMSGRDGNGSVKTKPSSEAMRPKKEKKKFSRKPPSLHSGTVTSKADIFEARVATAVDEADTSDSDETFVYESNPPENRPSRNHSRTPSGASGAGQQNKLKNGSHNISGKKSMKFTSSTYSNLDGEHGPSDITRGNSRTSTPRHHHIGRYGRPGHPSLFDQDSPFSQANKPNSPRASVGNFAKISRPNSPRVSSGKSLASPRKGETFAYDMDDDAADDERMPLMGSVRVTRSRGHNRRPNSSLRQIEYEDNDPRGCLSGWGCCAVVTILLLLLCTGVGTFVVALNRALLDVSITGIQNVLASEQELMLDLEVSATNPNLFVISVTDLDVNLFAESAYVGTAENWRTNNPSILSRGSRSQSSKGVIAVSSPWWWPDDDGIDEGNDPIDDPEPGVTKMLLGRILEFDSPLVFESSPLMRTSSSSVGEIRLAKPGNKTEEGGSLRWERVLQHPFELIVRGVIKYQLPISSKTLSAKIGSRIKVLPDTPIVEDPPSNGTAPDDGNSTSPVIVGTVS